MNNLNSKNENLKNVNNKKKNNAMNIFFSVLKGIKIFILFVQQACMLMT